MAARDIFGGVGADPFTRYHVEIQVLGKLVGASRRARA